MTELGLQNTIDSVFNVLTDIEVVHDNETYSGSAEEWIRISVQNSIGRRITLGDNPLYRYNGMCYVQIFVKPDTGAGRALEIADMIVPLLRDKNIDGVQFKVPVITKVGVDKGWYQVNVSTGFYRED